MASDVTIDRFGRILIPKALRQRHGWNSGLALRLEPDGEGLRVVPAAAPSGAGVTMHEGRVVFDATWHGPLPAGHDDPPPWNPPAFTGPTEPPA